MPKLASISGDMPIPEGIIPKSAKKEPNPLTPTLKSPLENPTVKAIINARQEYSRKWVWKHASKEQRKLLDVIGEPANDNPNHFWEYQAAFVVFTMICHIRKVEGNPAPELLKAEGAEWERFLYHCRMAGVGLDE